MSLRETRTRRNYRGPKATRAYVYTEENKDLQVPDKYKTKYIIHFSGKNGNRCCMERASPDEEFFTQELIELKRGGTTLIEKLPPGLKPSEGTVIREPYHPTSLSQTPASYKGNK